MIKNKLKASLIHLILSILLVSLTMGTVIFFFFPTLFISVTDFKEVAMIILSVDLILGPLLTFVVFQPKKKSLRFDLSVIAAIQIVALAYGVYSLYQIHPVYITFNIDRFTLISAQDAKPEKSQYDEFRVSKFTAGKLAFAKMPEDIEKRNEVALTAGLGGGDLDQRVEYYEPYKSNIAEVIAKSLDPKDIFKTDKAKEKAKEFLSTYQNSLDLFAFLPVNSSKKDAIVIINKETGNPVATLAIDPWNLSKNNQ